jgi:serine/threonine protein kinase
MMNHSLKSLCKVSQGSIIQGKWHNNRYTIVKELGFGANGIVYLAQYGKQLVALKMSDNSMSVTSEVNVLKSFAKVQGSTLGPSLLDVDDWDRRIGRVSFYVMEYMEGPDLLSFVSQKGLEWAYVLVLQLLSDLGQLHQQGWAFGDLKPDNLIITGPPPTIRCIDVGGTTKLGRAIKEFTEFFDRGYWGLGSRKAEPSYDLFAVAMIIINMVYPKRFNKTTGGMAQLKTMIHQKPELKKIENVLFKALNGDYSSAYEMRNEMIQGINFIPPRPHQSRGSRNQHASVGKRQNKRQSRKSGMVETMIITAVILFLYIFYIYEQLL